MSIKNNLELETFNLTIQVKIFLVFYGGEEDISGNYSVQESIWG